MTPTTANASAAPTWPTPTSNSTYDAATRAAIEACLRFKGEHNLRRMGLLRDPLFAPEPQAAAAA